MTDSFNSRATLSVGDRAYEIRRLASLQERFDVQQLPFSMKILLENSSYKGTFQLSAGCRQRGGHLATSPSTSYSSWTLLLR